VSLTIALILDQQYIFAFLLFLTDFIPGIDEQQRDRETERQRDRETERQNQTQRKRQIERQRKREKQRE
jgi:hypothetical protein